MSGILERLETKLDILIAKLGTSSVAELGEAIHQLADTPVDTRCPAQIDQDQADAEQSTAITIEQITQAEINAGTLDPYAGVDKDGVAWDARIHSKAKEPKSETTGKWKKRKGLKDGVYDKIMAELKATAEERSDLTANGPFFWVDTVTNVSNTCDTRAEMDQLLTVPTTKELSEAEFDALLLTEAPATGPKAPLAPKAPSAPAAPVAKAPAAPVANPVANPVKAEVLGLIKDLTVELKVEPNDITMLMKEVTGFDTINKIADDMLVLFRDALVGWHDTVADATNAVNAMNAIAEPLGFTENLNEGIEGILEPHDADCVGIVHYSAIAGVNDQLQAYLKTWQEL